MAADDRPRAPLVATVVVLCALACVGTRPALAKEQVVKLELRVEGAGERLFLPFERRRLLAKDGVQLLVARGKPLRCRVLSGERIHVDVRGDGRFGEVLRRGEVLELVITGASGATQQHAIRMVNDVYGRPCLEPACARVGKLKGKRIVVVDADLNGRYSDYGRDLMVVGKLPYAFPLSRLVVVGRQAFHIDVDAEGRLLTATPSAERLAKLDFTSKLAGLKKPRMVVLRRPGKPAADHVVALRSPGLVPAGDWSVAYAAFSDELWAVADDAVKPMSVSIGGTPVRWSWGAPFALRGKAMVMEYGTHRTFVPPGRLRAPRLIERRVEGKHVVSYFPPEVVGSAGLRYVANWQHAGSDGVVLADEGITHFDVHIAQGGTRLNAQMHRWAPYDMSGLVRKVPVAWTSFEWPAGDVRGTLTVTFRCASRVFGGALTSTPLQLQLK